MKDNLLHVFDTNDGDYFQWLKNHQDGYVLNTTRVSSSSYLVLHKSTCPQSQNMEKKPKKGGFTEHEYIKICSDNLELDKILGVATWETHQRY